MASRSRLAAVLYKAVLQEARGLDQVLTRRAGQVDVHRELARLERALHRPLTPEAQELVDATGAPPSVRAALSAAFRREVVGRDPGDEVVDVAFDAIRRLGTRRATLLSDTWVPKPAHVALDIGTVYRHKKHGFRGVVIDWFPRCPAGETWVDEYGPFEKGLMQAFYKTCVCTRDRPRPFIALAAEENLIPVEPGSDDASIPVEHPLVGQIFGDFHDGHHLLLPSLWEKWPEDF